MNEEKSATLLYLFFDGYGSYIYELEKKKLFYNESFLFECEHHEFNDLSDLSRLLCSFKFLKKIDFSEDEMIDRRTGRIYFHGDDNLKFHDILDFEFKQL